MVRSKEYSTAWVEIILAILIMALLGLVLYFTISNQPTHTNSNTMISSPNTAGTPNTEGTPNTATTADITQNKAAVVSKAAIQTQKSVQMVPITITSAPKATVIQSDASRAMEIKIVKLTPVLNPPKRWKFGKGFKLIRVRRPIRRIPEGHHPIKG